jgi:hypothetical protein
MQRGMTLAPRTEVFLQIACENLWNDRHHTSHHRHIDAISYLSPSIYPFNDTALSHSTLYTHTDSPVYPFLHLVPLKPTYSRPVQDDDRDDLPAIGDPPIDCVADPRIQASAANMQTRAFNSPFAIIHKQLLIIRAAQL